jgi:hypothetical protein
MDRNLLTYFARPSLLQSVSAAELEAYVKEFPYFPVGHMLLAKKYQQENHPAFKEQLARAALAIHDRRLLHAFISGEETPLSRESVLPSESLLMKPSISEEASTDEHLQEVLRTIHEGKLAMLRSAAADSPDEKRSAEEKASGEDLELKEMAKAAAEFSAMVLPEENSGEFARPYSEGDAINRIEEEGLEQVEFEEHEDMITVNELAGGGAEYLPTEYTEVESSEEEFIIEQDAEIQSFGVIEEEFIAREAEFGRQEEELEVISFSEGNVDVEKAEPTPIESDISDLEIQSEVRLETQLESDESVTTKAAAPHDTFRINEEVNTPGEFLPEKSYSFSQWLKFFRLSQPPPVIPNAKAGNGTEKESKGEKEDETEQVNLHMKIEMENIDKAVSMLKQGSFDPTRHVSAEELAKKSAQMDEEIVSETLAKIFETQGYYDKAIRMYVKLSLKVPDKVSFFAARIKELKAKK